MTLAYIGIAIAVALVFLTVVWGMLHPAKERERREATKRYGGFRRAHDESDSA